MEHAQTVKLVTLCSCPLMKRVPKVMTIAIRLQPIEIETNQPEII